MVKQKAKFEKLDPSKWFDESSGSYAETSWDASTTRGKGESSTTKGNRFAASGSKESPASSASGKGSKSYRTGNYSSLGSQNGNCTAESSHEAENSGHIVEAGVKTTLELRMPERLNTDLRSWRSTGGGQRIVLMVTEKPSIAKTLSSVLSDGTEVWKRHGTSPFSPVYEYEGRFHGVASLFRITGVCGHVFGTNFPEEWNNWRNHPPHELFQAPTVKEEADARSKMLGHLRAEAKGAAALLLWLDCDREGENIAFEVIGLCAERMTGPRLVLRAQFSSLDPRDLWRAYEHLGQPDERLSEAVEARMVVDLKLGVAFSRFITMFVQKDFKSLADRLGLKLISYGPCQVPALWFVVKRQDEIAVFVPEPFWELWVDVALARSGAKLSFKRVAGPLWYEHEAITLRNRLQDKNKTAYVTKVSRRPIKKPRPLPLNTVKFLQKASAQLRIGAHQALSIAEALYIAGLITYPRTETTKHAASFDSDEILTRIVDIDDWFGASARTLQKTSKCEGPRTDGWDAGDHPPITPIRIPGAGDRLDSRHWRVYELIAVHFLMSISTDFILEEITATVDVGGEAFSASASTIVEPGWTVFESHSSQRRNDPKAAMLEHIYEGQQISVSAVRRTRHETEPPALLTESDLLGLMERFGIGTDATMATHIETITKRGYVALDDTTRILRPLPLGRALLHGLALVDGDLCSPIVRASIEADVSQVAQGLSSRSRVESHALRLFTRKFERFSTQVSVVPLMLAAAYAEEAGQSVPRAAAELWDRAIRSVAAVDLDTLRPTDAAAWNDAAEAAAQAAGAVVLPSLDIVNSALSEAGLAATNGRSNSHSWHGDADWLSWTDGTTNDHSWWGDSDGFSWKPEGNGDACWSEGRGKGRRGDRKSVV